MISEVTFSSKNIVWVYDTDSWDLDLPRQLSPGSSDHGQCRVAMELKNKEAHACMVSESTRAGFFVVRALGEWGGETVIK